MKPTAVSQKSTYRSLREPFTKFVAERAIDGNLETFSQTICAWDYEHWYKLKFDALYCFSTIVIINQHTRLQFAHRIDDTKVFVVNSLEETEFTCGVIKVSNVSTLERQTYRIPCHGKCGDEVKLTLEHWSGKHSHVACINMKEIKAFQGKLLS